MVLLAYPEGCCSVDGCTCAPLALHVLMPTSPRDLSPLFPSFHRVQLSLYATLRWYVEQEAPGTESRMRSLGARDLLFQLPHLQRLQVREGGARFCWQGVQHAGLAVVHTVQTTAMASCWA